MKRIICLMAVLIGLELVMAGPAAAQGSDPVCATESYAGYTYKVCKPESNPEGAALPLVLMLHGCTQTHEEFERDTEMTLLAQERDFIVVYPDQPSTANASKCWNWFLPEHQARGSGEPAVLTGIVERVAATYPVDACRTYVAGLSAGAAMSVILGATYPDVFAAIGVSAGLEYKAGTDLVSGVLAQVNGGPDPDQQGTLAYQAMGEHARVVPVIVFHGSMDATVSPVNGDQVISQWAQTNDLAADGADDDNIDDIADATLPGQVPGGRAFTRTIYHGQTGGSLLEKYIVEGMTHRWSGGSPGGTYTDPTGPDASTIMLDFFFERPLETCTPTAASLVGLGAASPSTSIAPSLALAALGAAFALAIVGRRRGRKEC